MDTKLFFNTDFYTNMMPQMAFPIVNFQERFCNIQLQSFPFLNQPLIIQNFNFNFNFSSASNNKCEDTFVKTTDNQLKLNEKPEAKQKKISNKKNFLGEYNPQAGKKLSQIALRDSIGFNGQCATYVKSAIQKAGLGEYKKGDAYKMTSILKNNPKFKEISPKSVDVQNLPAGCVLVYNKGKEGYSQSYGHTEITTGDGRAVSDGITKNLHKQPSAVFVPVSA